MWVTRLPKAKVPFVVVQHHCQTECRVILVMYQLRLCRPPERRAAAGLVAEAGELTVLYEDKDLAGLQ